MSFKTGTVKHGAPSDISSSIYSLLNKLQNVNNTDTKFSLDVDRFSNDLRIHTMYAKNKGNNDDTANAKALASTSETSVGNVPFNSSISKYSDNVKKFSLDVDRFSNDLRNAQLWQYDGYEHFFKANELYQQKNDMLNCHAK